MKKNTLIIIELLIILLLLIILAINVFTNDTPKAGAEIEKKWLIRVEDIPYDLSQADKCEIEQTYFNFSPEMRVRKINNGEEYIMAIKRDTEYLGTVRSEEEYYITEEEYNNLIKKKEGNTIYKTRYTILDKNNFVSIDIFKGDLEGLAYMEIEFPTLSMAEKYKDPEWVVKDVTTDLSYKNGHLARYGIPSSYYEYISINNL